MSHSRKLSEARYLRTERCGHYEGLLKQKDVAIARYPIIELQGSEFSTDYVLKNGLDAPLLVHKMPGIQVPPPKTSLQNVAETIGPEYKIKVIEVGAQDHVEGFTIGDFAAYLGNYVKGQHKVLNLISLEFSATPLASRIQSPEFVRDLDWIDAVWPLERRARGDYPAVQKYCLSGMGGSYTDFHVDFGGTSVWYHVVWGKKRFYLIAPTCANLRTYEKWVLSDSQDQTFLGDLVPPGECVFFELEAGQTFIIPGGWIHSVFTPEDSLVFGGNFLHSSGILRQLQVYEIEQRTRLAKEFRFPYFREINWHFLCSLLPLAKATYLKADAASSSKEDSAGADTDDDEDLQQLCGHLKSPTIRRQLPFLVRVVETWLGNSNEYFPTNDRSRMKMESQQYLKIAQDHNSTPEEVMDTWWSVLLAIADSVDKEVGGEQVERAFVARVRRMDDLSLSVLDENCVAGTFASSLDILSVMKATGDLERGHDFVRTVKAGGTISSSKSAAVFGGPISPAVVVTSSAAAATSASFSSSSSSSASSSSSSSLLDMREGEEGGKPLPLGTAETSVPSKIRFKFNKEAETSAATMQEGESGPTGDAKMKFRMPPKPSEGEQAAPDAVTTEAETENAASGGDAQQPKVMLHLKMPKEPRRQAAQKPQQSSSSSSSSIASAAKSKKRPLDTSDEAQSRKPRARKADSSHVEETTIECLQDVDTTGAYGTRGKKLSAAFLKHAEDDTIITTSGAVIQTASIYEGGVKEEEEYDVLNDRAEVDEDEFFVATGAELEDEEDDEEDDDDESADEPSDEEEVDDEDDDWRSKKKSKASAAKKKQLGPTGSKVAAAPAQKAKAATAPAPKKPANHKSNVMKLLGMRR